MVPASNCRLTIFVTRYYPQVIDIGNWETIWSTFGAAEWEIPLHAKLNHSGGAAARKALRRLFIRLDAILKRRVSLKIKS